MQKKSKNNTFKDNFQELLNFVPDSIIILNKEGTVLAANEVICKFLGFANEELVGKHIENFKFFDEKTKMLIQRQLKKRLKGEVIENYEIPVFVNGETRYFEPKGKRMEYFGEPADLIILNDVTDKKQLQNQLLVKIEEMDEHCHESEGKYSKLFQESLDAIVVADAETGIIVDCNIAASLLVGRDKADLIGQHQSILHPQRLTEVGFTKGFKEHFKNPMKPRETQVVTKTGEIKYVSIRASVFEFQGKKLIQGTFRDITERKLMQQALKENEEKFHGIANSVRDAIILVDEEAKVTYWNPAAEKMFGYSSSEAIGKDVHALIVPVSISKEGKAQIETSVKLFTETGTGYFTVGNVELVARRKDGTEFPAKLAISPIKLGGKWSAVGVVKDITRRKQADQMQREAEQRYHALFDQSPLGVLVVDPETAAFVEFNDVAYQQLGYSRQEFSKLRLPDIEAKESPDQVRSHVTEMLKEGGGEFETEHRTKNGDIRNVLVTTRTFELAGRTFLHSIFHDITEIRKVQNTLIESEARYRQLVELAQEGIWALNNDFTTVFVNPRMAQLLGYTENEMIGKSLFEFLDRDVIEQAKHFLTQFKQGIKGQFVCVFPRKDGTHIDTSVAASTITDDRGQVIGTLALMADITERKKLEGELRASEERFRAISTSAMDAIILVDQEDTVIYWNPAAEKTFGFAETDAIGKKLSELVIPPSGRKNHALLLQELSQASFSARHFELTAIRKDGTKFPMDLSVARVKLKDKNCLLSIVGDVSERKVMEEALRQERDILESVAANIEAGLTLISKDYRILWANQLLKQISGNDLENRLCYSIYDQSNRICPDCGVKKVFETGVAVDRHDYHYKFNGRDDWVELIVSPVKDKDGKVVAALELAVNINERKRLQNKLSEYSQRLEEIVQKRTDQLKKTQAELVKSERLAAIGELAGMIGHDLRNPLTGIKNSAYFLKKKGNTIPETQIKEMLETIDKCVDYSNKIVNDLLDYSREIHLELQERSPRQLIAEALAMVNVPEKVEVLNQLPDEPHIEVDPNKINRVFINLIKNAIEAMSNVGKITIYGKKGNGCFEISFEDTGAGISDEILPKLFSPLFTTKAQGMGFGLAICKRIIESHEGTIKVKTSNGEGTTFMVNLPIEHKPKIGGEKIWINMPESLSSTMTKQ
ncbi:MAG: PAS domain S-box protein [Candidatus Bathyarchaeia archaeon]